MSRQVLVLGFGVEGKILAEYLAKTDEVTIADQKSMQDMDQKVIAKFDRLGVNWKLGRRYLDDLGKFDLIAHSPGIFPEVRKAVKDSGVKTTTQTEIFLEQCVSKNIIGVTGTNGKGTTCTLISEMIKSAGKKVFLVGNIGEGMLNHLPEIMTDDWIVMELSSYQLRDVTRSPHIGVALNITPDHMNIHTDMNEYIASKAKILEFQTPDDIAVINGDYEVTRNLAKKTKAKIVWFSRSDIQGRYRLGIPGEHNLENAAAAVQVAKIVGVREDVIKKVLVNFRGLEHRLQTVASVNGVQFVDDSISTNPATTMAAIRSFGAPKIIILGGSSKNAEFREMAEAVTADRSIKAVILTGQTGKVIEAALKKAGYDRLIEQADTMPEIVQKAIGECQPGDVVLLSPGCASFGSYVDYKDRGKKFIQAVNQMKNYLLENKS